MVCNDVTNAPTAVASARFAVISDDDDDAAADDDDADDNEDGGDLHETCRLPARCAGGAASPPASLRGGSSNARAEPRHGNALISCLRSRWATA